MPSPRTNYYIKTLNSFSFLLSQQQQEQLNNLSQTKRLTPNQFNQLEELYAFLFN